MGFQLPPTLPDYNKLTAQLNSSGFQKVNPPVYEILSRLIQAVSQSQDVISTNIADIPSSVIVSPTGALSGDGTSGSPLAVKVDGVTVTINGSDQLVAGGTPLIFRRQLILTDGQLNACGASANKTIQIIPAGGANTVIIPFHVTVQMTQVANAFLLGQTVQFTYSSAAGSLVVSGAVALFGTLTANITNNGGAAVNRITLLDGGGGTWDQTTAANAITNKDVLGLLSGTAVVTNASPSNFGIITVDYAVFANML